MLAVEGEADHAKRRACVIARRSSTKHSCGLRLIPVPDVTLSTATGYRVAQDTHRPSEAAPARAAPT